MTGVDVEHTKALEAAATPGEWVADQSSDPRQMGVWLDDATGTMIAAHTTEADAKYIAHMKNTHPALVAAVERVQAQVDKTLEILDRYNHSDDGDLPECAPEDRWRLYRDLLATLNPEALETKP